MIEHLDPPRLAAFERVVFGTRARAVVVVTTPNVEYNVRFETLPAGSCATATTASSGRAPSSRRGRTASASGTATRVEFGPIGTDDPERRRADADGGVHADDDAITIPDLCLVTLVGVSGSGKSTFAARHFAPTEVVSSDFCRGLVADDENDQTATDAAFEVLHTIAGEAARGGPAHGRRRHQRPPDDRAPARGAGPRAITCFPSRSCSTSRRRSATSATRRAPTAHFGAHVVRNQRNALRRSLKGLHREGLPPRVTCCAASTTIDAATVEREPLWTDRRDLTGPFDIIGDIHGCHAELVALLTDARLGRRRPTAPTRRHPDGRTAVFLGDLVDRGPAIAGGAAPRR